MEIHKPKPWHGWREFLKEYAIIVLGVLTALVAEQIVEALHQRETVAWGEGELRNNFVRFIQYSAELKQENACMTARAAELRTILDQANRSHELPAIAAIPEPFPRPWEIDTWEALVSGGAAPYLSRERAVLYSRIARSGYDIYETQFQRTADWGALASLAGSARPFSEAEAAQDRAYLTRGVEWSHRMQYIAERTLERISETGLIDAATTKAALARGARPDHVVEMCQPISAARPLSGSR
ncbi:MAG TPA: hypothetical protein VHV27_08340 [Phenylobacterium sp.]|nr:hypothetical protein [Phenylobacterium sp.]